MDSPRVITTHVAAVVPNKYRQYIKNCFNKLYKKELPLYQAFLLDKNEINTSFQIDIENNSNFLQYNDKIKEKLIYGGKSRQNFQYP
ncbi:hypothetical protein [Brevinema andersonii]|uniref:hypothetical protein n=1 Tax=Brevinema andersonii TaxID=34097 RepID=UPI000B8360C2|nr:hypothetical protein [Brevinema andersonii]